MSHATLPKGTGHASRRGLWLLAYAESGLPRTINVYSFGADFVFLREP